MARRSYGGISAGHGEGSRVVVGAIILLLGVLFLLENLGFLPVVRLWAFWPVILIAAGIARLIEARAWQSQIGGAVMAGIGAVFLAINIGLLPPVIWRLLWPALLILVGVFLLVRGFDTRLEIRGAFHHDV